MRRYVIIILVSQLLMIIPHTVAGTRQEGWSVRSREEQVAARLNLKSFTFQEVELFPSEEGELTATIAIGTDSYTLQLQPYSLRSENFRLLVQDEAGSMLDVDPPPPVTYQGRLLEVPESVVAASADHGQLVAFIRFLGEVWVLQPLTELDPSAPISTHVLYRASDVIPAGWTCGTDEEPLGVDAGGEEASMMTYCPSIAEIAFDADYEYYRLNGSVDATVADIEGILNSVTAIYQTDTDIVYDLTTILVRTSEPDPYGSTDPVLLLDEFRGEWESNQGGIDRDVAHLMTGKDLDGSVIGIAYVGVTCNLPWSYGVSQSRFTANFAERVALTAHELGHNWNAGHCDGDPDGCNIMCSAIGGCSGIIDSFAPVSINAIVGWRNSQACFNEVVHVDLFASPPFYGTLRQPFQRVSEGVQCVAPGGRIRIDAGTYSEAPLTIGKSSTLEAVGGTVTIR